MDQLLPKQLQTSLENLLQEQSLSGWTIHGNLNGNLNGTMVLRFKMVDINENLSKETIKYKSASTSQVARDSQRNDQRNMVPETTNTKVTGARRSDLTDFTDTTDKPCSTVKCTEKSCDKSPQLTLPSPMTR